MALVHRRHVLRRQREPLAPVERAALREVEAVLELDGADMSLISWPNYSFLLAGIPEDSPNLR